MCISLLFLFAFVLHSRLLSLDSYCSIMRLIGFASQENPPKAFNMLVQWHLQLTNLIGIVRLWHRIGALCVLEETAI
jgi:hypothetical protein